MQLPKLAELSSSYVTKSAGTQDIAEIGTRFFRMRQHLNGVMKNLDSNANILISCNKVCITLPAE